MSNKDNKQNLETKFKVLKTYTNEQYYNAIDVDVDGIVYQITVDKKVTLDDKIVNKDVKLRFKEVDGKKYFDIINYELV